MSTKYNNISIMKVARSNYMCILVILGLLASVIVTGCIDRENGDIGTPTPQQTTEQVVINPTSPEKTLESNISSGTDAMMEKYSLEKLVSMSDSIVIGEVANLLPSKWNTLDEQKPTGVIGTSDVIYTDATIKVEEDLKGPLGTTTITVRVLGGTVGQDKIEVEDQPSYNLNEKVLVFLKEDIDPRTKDIGDRHFVTAGLFQGKISILQNNEIIIGDEKMSLDDVRIRITEVGSKNTTAVGII